MCLGSGLGRSGWDHYDEQIVVVGNGGLILELVMAQWIEVVQGGTSSELEAKALDREGGATS